MKATVKQDHSGPFVTLKADSQGEETGVGLIPEIVSMGTLSQNRGRVLVSVRNITNQPVSLKPCMVIGPPL